MTSKMRLPLKDWCHDCKCTNKDRCWWCLYFTFRESVVSKPHRFDSVGVEK